MKFFKIFKEFIKKLQKNKIISITAVVLFWLMPAIYLFEMESFNFYPKIFLTEFLPNRISVVIFGLILLYILFAAVYFLTKKAWITLALCGFLATGASLANYIKYSLTGENFFPHDIIMAGNMNELVGFAVIDVAWWMWAFFAFTVFSVLILGLFCMDAPFKTHVRLPFALALISIIVMFFGNGPNAGKLFNKFYMTFESTSLQSSNYRENGFVGAFSINIAAFAIQPPEGYSDSTLESILNAYAEIPPSADYKNPDIIVVLNESFWDPRLLPETLISPNPFINFDQLVQKENAYQAKLIVPALGGGTIRTEFEILTGLSCDALPSGVIPYNIIKKNIPSYITYYKSLGYDAIAFHPYLARFYNRDICLPRIGFETYYGEELLKKIDDIDPIYKGGYISDESFVEYMKYFLNQKSNNPLFLFGITMENHQRYRFKYDYTKFTISAYNPNLNASDQHNLEHYTQGVQHADEALGQICEFIDNRERPTVLVFFGDHLPSICTEYSAYLDTGFVEDTYSTASREKLYAAPMIIYANFKLNTEAANYDMIASYDLLNVLSTMIGSGKNKYMSYLDDLRGILPYYNSRLEMLKTLTPEQKNLLQVQYYNTYRSMTK